MTSPNIENVLFQEFALLIERARNKVSKYINSSLIHLYWEIGKKAHHDILNNEKPKYGEEILKSIAQKLMFSYGRGFSYRSLLKMVRFYKLYPGAEISPTLSAKLTWSHIVELISIEEELKRKFYLEMIKIEQWSVRELRKKLDSMLYERTALSQNSPITIKSELINLEQNQILSQKLIFRDPYILDFLQLPAEFSESDFENAILNDLSKFLSELGTDFCFIARQKRLVIDNESYYIDLLMFHRGLNRLIAIELKLGSFKASYKGQMELYLRWLDRHERKSNEDSPLGLILCSDKKQEQIELLELDKSGIHVSQYLTELPAREILEQRLHQAIELARANNLSSDVKLETED